jgi:tRNA (adenine37-N6)-methyltransferase
LEALPRVSQRARHAALISCAIGSNLPASGGGTQEKIMAPRDEIRRNEIAVEWPARIDAGLTFIGVIRTPWASREECPHYGSPDGPVCRIEVSAPWDIGLDGIEAVERIEVFYWLHLSRRDLVRQSPGRDGRTKATFTIRSPVRPNPIGASIVALVAREGGVLHVRGLDCVDGTPLLDLKPDRSHFRSD